MSTVSSVTASLGRWYACNKRDLPWRNTRDPYKIWLSEVILQQTRVDQGMAYWHRFVDRYPTVMELAAAPEDDVLKLWQGLGYYSRARNLLIAARQVVMKHNGRFPEDHEGLLSLKGVGDYTAAAIGSICFGNREPVVDGNVFRVLARAFGLGVPIDSSEGRREFRELAGKLLDHSRPGDHNQAVMELGATVCTPKQPKCSACPIKQMCVALRDDRIGELPVKIGRTKVRTRHFNYLFVQSAGKFFIRKRIEKDIWRNMYELPLIETEAATSAPELLSKLEDLVPFTVAIEKQSARIDHVLSHQRIQAIFWELSSNEIVRPPKDWIPVSLKELEQYALPRLLDRWLEERT